jgi:ABC-type Fe3+-hydroxamate transport system substrate-binding protein
MNEFIDQLGRPVFLSSTPKRIISLVPSQTELLFDLGLEKEVIGITKFCIHPEHRVKHTQKIGGTKTLDLERIRKLKPDLIIGNKEENEQGQIECLMNEFPVWMSDIYTFKDAISMIEKIGVLTGKSANASNLSAEISEKFNLLSSAKLSSRTTIAYLIWKNPYMVAGNDTFINDVLKIGGLENTFAASRYPTITADDLRQKSPDIIFLSSEPYPFAEKHIKEFKEICPNAKTIIIDGELFSWYGSRLKYTADYLMKLKDHISII